MSASRLRSELAVARTVPVLPNPGTESSDHLGDVAISTRHRPPRSGATKRRYHGPDHERDCLLGRPGRPADHPGDVQTTRPPDSSPGTANPDGEPRPRPPTRRKASAAPLTPACHQGGRGRVNGGRAGWPA